MQPSTKTNKVKTKKKDTPWTKLGVMVDINEEILTRNVLFEKYNFKKAKEAEMRIFFISKINGCELYLNSEYSDYVFYIKTIKGNKEILMERNEKNKTFYIKYDGLWSVFEDQYMLEYADIQLLTQTWLLDSLNSKGYKTRCGGNHAHGRLLDSLNSKGYKTHQK